MRLFSPTSITRSTKTHMLIYPPQQESTWNWDWLHQLPLPPTQAVNRLSPCVRANPRGEEVKKERYMHKRVKKRKKGKRWCETKTDWKKSKQQERRGWEGKIIRISWGGVKWQEAGKGREKKGETRRKKGMAGGERRNWSPETQQWIKQLAGDANSAL